jgi:hypothetical protein
VLQQELRKEEKQKVQLQVRFPQPQGSLLSMALEQPVQQEQVQVQAWSFWVPQWVLELLQLVEELERYN